MKIVSKRLVTAEIECILILGPVPFEVDISEGKVISFKSPIIKHFVIRINNLDSRPISDSVVDLYKFNRDKYKCAVPSLNFVSYRVIRHILSRLRDSSTGSEKSLLSSFDYTVLLKHDKEVVRWNYNHTEEELEWLLHDMNLILVSDGVGKFLRNRNFVI